MSIADLPKQYDPHEAERKWYALWLDRGYFTAHPESEKPAFTIVIPPPNVTGALHLGHALNNTLQDILTRWRRMQGYDALWMPGTDHAGIATQAVVERRIFEEEKKNRHDLGRDALVERIWAWKDEYEARILGQLKLMGCSCDWSRTRFTLDEVCSKAVRRTFFNLFKADKIFRGKRLVNWDTQLRTAVADDEIYYEDIQGHLWTIKYPVADSDGDALSVSTTRPETMLGDTAVAVHPDDPRYQHLIGREVELPLTGRRIPILADPILVDPEFGTGCVKVTPAHDPNDYQTGLRHNLPMINLLNPDGSYNENAGAYAGLPGKDVRKRVVADLESQGLLIKTEPYATRVNYSDRSKTPIEPYLSDQWFVRMGDDPDGTPGFAQQAINAVESGQVRITPDRYRKSYTDWLTEKRDWCISRQLWWGHRIPVWTRRVTLSDQVRQVLEHFFTHMTERSGDSDGERLSAHQQVFDALSGGARETFRNHPHVEIRMTWNEDHTEVGFLACVDEGHEDLETRLESEFGFERDPDVLDTWFSSALWPHSTLGWPETTSELQKYYPTSVLSTARDIITLWVARMVIFGQFNVGDVPFRDVFIHPVIQDGDGKRMSKTAGNGIDPVDIIEAYGADALRFTLALSATETQDLRIPVEPVKNDQGLLAYRSGPDGTTQWLNADQARVTPKRLRVNTSERFEQGRTFPNKFWNSARFALMNMEGYTPGHVDLASLTIEDRWILSGLDDTIAAVTTDLVAFRFADAARTLRDFTWNSFCDWYVEFLKARLRDESTRPVAQRVLAAVLDGLCRLLHPIMPFVTESVWQALGEVAPVRGLPEPSRAEESVCIADWPVRGDASDPDAAETVRQWQEKIQAIRNLRAERNVPVAARIAPILVAEPAVADRLRSGESHICTLTGAESLEITPAADRPRDAAVAVLPDAEIILPLAGLIDKDAERARLTRQLGDLDKQLSSVRSKLNNESFVSKAPASVVDQQRQKESELLAQHQAVEALLEGLS